MEIEFINHIDGRKKDKIEGVSQYEESVSHITIKRRVKAVSTRGPIFIEGVIKGVKDKGENIQLIADPLTTAPILRFNVGIMKGVPFSKDILGAGWFER